MAFVSGAEAPIVGLLTILARFGMRMVGEGDVVKPMIINYVA